MKRNFWFLFALILITLEVYSNPIQVRMHGRKYGMFANMNQLIGLLDAYEREHFPFSVDFSKGLYYEEQMGPNWWEYYFDPIHLHFSSTKPTLELQEGLAENLGPYTKFVLSRERKNYLLKKYIKIKECLSEKIEGLREELFGDSFIIAVHFRNTDKHLIYSPPNAEKVIEKVKQQIIQVPTGNYKIFVSTDDANFLEKMIGHFHEKVVYSSAFRSIDSSPLHGNKNYSPYLHGEEGVVDCKLLSYGDILIKTQSNLNEIAAAWNLNLKVIDVEPQIKKWNPKTPEQNYLTEKWIEQQYIEQQKSG